MSDMESRVAALEDAITGLRDLPQAIAELTSAIQGAPKWGTPGLVKRLADVEEETRTLKSRLDRALWVVAGCSIGAGLAGGATSTIIASLIGG